jgi:hypothetical protein
MNPRIRLLAEQAEMAANKGDSVDVKIMMEKFAQLIVKECCEVLEQTEDALDRQKWPTPRGCVEYIKDHFGVEQ